MTNAVPSPEAMLKASVIDRLFASRLVDEDAVIVSEMVIADWSRRADVVLANGSLMAFEIKSEADSLSRLAGQMESFSAHFEKLILVVAERFEQRVMELAADGVGVWVAASDGTLTEKRRPKKRALAPDAAIALMTVTDLKRLMTCNGIDRARFLPRRELEKLALQLPASDLANAAREAVKRRHRARHLAFLTGRADAGTLDALSILRRERRKAQQQFEVNFYHAMTLPEIEIGEDNPLLVNAPAGPILRRARN